MEAGHMDDDLWSLPQQRADASKLVWWASKHVTKERIFLKDWHMSLENGKAFKLFHELSTCQNYSVAEMQQS
eukprot:10714-Pleurochrysis_carterae.AAC.1